MEIWNKLKQPPPSALKTIQGGRLKGMTDVNPQWRYQAMTEQFGVCGEGWKYQIERLWMENAGDQVCAFAEIKLFIKTVIDSGGGSWSDPIPGIGGSKLISKETSGSHVSDECYKMAVTDALSVAMKMLGVAADIYAGLWDGSKYKDATNGSKAPSQAKKEDKTASKEMSAKQWSFIKKLGEEIGMTEPETVIMVKWVAEENNLEPRHWKISKLMLPEENFAEQIRLYSEANIKETMND